MKCKTTCVTPSIGSKQQHCGICHETFAAPSVGDGHRTPVETDENGRRTSYRNRCLTHSEMEALGWRTNRRGIWQGAPRENEEAVAS